MYSGIFDLFPIFGVKIYWDQCFGNRHLFELPLNYDRLLGVKSPS